MNIGEWEREVHIEREPEEAPRELPVEAPDRELEPAIPG